MRISDWSSDVCSSDLWQAAYPQERWRMSVNLSTRQVLHPKLLETVDEALTSSGLDPSTLMLELTESVLLTDSEQVLRRLHRLKDLGVQIAIDDFGTGYSSSSEEHTSELQSLMRISYAVFCLKK